MTYFKSGDAANSTETTWSTWTKIGVVTPPALTVTVGTSNLTLSLRASAFTVQAPGLRSGEGYTPNITPSLPRLDVTAGSC